MTRLAGALVVAALVGCGGGNGITGTGGSTSTGGSTGTGGSIGTGGSTGTGGSIATGGAAGGGPIPIAEYEALALAAGCNVLVRCGLYPDQATCLSSDQVVPHLYDTLVADVASGKVLYDPAQGRACVDATNTLPCTRTALAASNPDDASCDVVFTGTVAAGGACFLDEECAGGGNCQIDYTSCPSGECCPGSCVAPPPTVGPGGDCSTYGTVTCAAGTTCTVDANGSTASCQATIALGGACVAATTAIPCTYPLYCDKTSGTCKAPASTGGACNPAEDALDCDTQTDHCDTTTLVCTPMVGPGSSCDPVYSACPTYAPCDAKTRTCVVEPAVGQACDPTGAFCQGGNCDSTSMTCTLMPTAGACS
jgi:hypothetical protein